MGVDVFGINCSTGPTEMENTIKLLSDHSPLPISIIPNAGMPENIDGIAYYKMTPELFGEVIGDYLNKYRISVVGGCCGTTPEHIKALRAKIQNPDGKIQNPSKPQALSPLPSFCSPISLPKEKDAPLIIGERINSQGSRKAKDLMLSDKYDELIDLTKSQEQQGADLIDCCFAMTERSDEENQLAHFAKKTAYATLLPLCFDSTEATVLESAVKAYAGKPLINSINLESEKIHQILPIVKQFGLSTIALCIDEQGMAKTVTEKINIAKKIYNIAITDYNLKPEQLIFDTLTFTLATGEEEWRDSAIETFKAIKLLKQELPGVKTVLGVSNVSFGLTPQSRKVLNLVYLHKAVEYGLDMAIFNAEHFHPLSTLNKTEVALAENLILNTKPNALTEFIEYFQNNKPDNAIQKTDKKISNKNISLDKLIQQKIVTRDKENIVELLEKLRQTMKTEEIINTVLLPAMKIVGDKMEKGEIILPFVLESAEIMKRSITHLEQYLDKNSNLSKGTIVLATVYGDVHDIGKNLVKTITENNGYKVIDLGKQVPADKIIETAIKENADAITLSALLVTTSKQMQLIVEKLHTLGKNIPVIIGGAAINENFANTISKVNGKPYKGGVFYSKDAFSGLKILEDIINKK
jgi:5-methyltetrahydrofolate--homocysteine methyltransferase